MHYFFLFFPLSLKRPVQISSSQTQVLLWCLAFFGQDELHLFVLLGDLHWYQGGDNLWKQSFAGETEEMATSLPRLTKILSQKQ